MRVVVTGSSGFIGSHLVPDLERGGHEVLGLSRASEGGLDLGDPRGLVERFRGADAVVHLAGTASKTAPERILGWLEVAATENVVRAARAAGVRRFVSVSTTDANLGTTPRTNAPESQTAEPVVPHAGRIAKSKEELLLGLGGPSFEPVILRAGFVYGKGDRTRAPRFVEEARVRGGIRLVGRPLAFVPTTGVANLVHALGLALESPRAAHGIYQIVDRELMTQLAFFEQYSQALGLPPPRRGGSLLVERWLAKFGRGLGDEGEVVRRGLNSTLDAKRARDELGYESQVSVEDGIESLARWVRELGGASALLAVARNEPDETSIESIVRGSR